MMWSVATGVERRVAWSVCVSLCMCLLQVTSVSSAKWLNRAGCRLMGSRSGGGPNPLHIRDTLGVILGHNHADVLAVHIFNLICKEP